MALCNEPATNREVVRLETDAKERCRAVYIPVDGPRPEVGVMLVWTIRHVHWNIPGGGQAQVRKVGYAFDPYPAI